MSATSFSTPLEYYPEPWNDLAPFGTKQMDEYLAGLVELTNKYRGLLEQFERAGVRDWSYEMQIATGDMRHRTGDTSADPDPLSPATTGPVTVTAEIGLLKELADELLKITDDQHDEYELDNQAGEAIRVQLEATR